jgi:primosomal protein N' (replication factor Y)
LTTAQRHAVEAIHSAAELHELRVLLLFGVPGSGKTEVYVRAIRMLESQGKQAIIIVPEIALATQLVQRLAKRFARAIVLHSGLTAKARAEALWRIKRGDCDVVIGTRSAVFAPCPNLGLIVVDEEQESSLKNLGAPFFHARDVAIKRAQLSGIPVVLGSATPALETWHNCDSLPHYQRLELNERVPGAELPNSEPIAYSSRDVEGGGGLLSPRLLGSLSSVLEDGAQAIILHNRRGYAPALRCQRCGQTLRCPRCDATLVFHRGQEPSTNRLKCHQCGFSTSDLPRECPDHSCGGTLVQAGSAIQRLDDELKRRYPQARVLRLDSDTMKRREDYVEALESFEARSADIMIGTQMVAKGLDFPAVRLVGVIDADAGLSIPDFRASERVFQLLMQVVGRAGRQAGESLALLQAENPDAPAVRYAIAMDYRRFAEHELRARERNHQPPFTRLVRIVLSDERPRRAREAAEQLSRELGNLAIQVHPQLRVEPADACVIPRLREMLRYQVLIRGPREGGLHTLLERAESQKCLWAAVRRITIDVDPLDLL